MIGVCPHCRSRISRNALGAASHIRGCLGTERTGAEPVANFLKYAQQVTIHGAPQRGPVRVATIDKHLGTCFVRYKSIHLAREALEAAGLVVVDTDPERRHYRRPPPADCGRPHPQPHCTCRECEKSAAVQRRLLASVYKEPRS